MTNDVLRAYGFTEALARAAAAEPGLYAGRVVSQSQSLYRVASDGGELFAEVSGRFRHTAATAADFPAVGDFVLLDRDGDGGGHAVIHRVLPRKSAFTRKAAGAERQAQVVAANIDTVFICMSLNQDFNLRRLERCFAIGYTSGAVPVALLTKAELCADAPARLAQAQSVCPGADVLLVSAMQADGCAQVLPYLRPGQTVALIGASGVGKSTLVNRLLGEERLAVNGLRNDDRGRHTTTRRALFRLPSGAMVIDTPGMRELGLWEAEPGLSEAFADVETLAGQCRFADCRHENEPGCAVRAARADGRLSEARWLSYCKLRQEAAYGADRAGYLAQKEKKFKEIAKLNRS